MNWKRIFKIIAGIVITVLFVVLLIIIWPWFLSNNPHWTCNNFGMTPNEFGDSFGVVTSMVTLLAFGAAALAVGLQGKELKEQRKELSLTRLEFELNRATNIILKQLGNFAEQRTLINEDFNDPGYHSGRGNKLHDINYIDQIWYNFDDIKASIPKWEENKEDWGNIEIVESDRSRRVGLYFIKMHPVFNSACQAVRTYNIFENHILSNAKMNDEIEVHLKTLRSIIYGEIPFEYYEFSFLLNKYAHEFQLVVDTSTDLANNSFHRAFQLCEFLEKNHEDEFMFIEIDK